MTSTSGYRTLRTRAVAGDRDGFRQVMAFHRRRVRLVAKGGVS